ncbi:hypothetical protein TIFTF001_053398 [Ficus carica]|uniref:Uncharacterized protein n=1 Tax=Ficus carica TaxID=3494 RepID=A0AA88EBE1_FICCA|nr:hypothetical protein TIFTF001_053398 [Ficus carica]
MISFLMSYRPALGKLPTGTTSCKAVRLSRAICETWDGDCYAF